MGEKTASQVQDVVVAGSQSSNFLLPKENKSLSTGAPPHSQWWAYAQTPANQTKPAEVTALSAGLWGKEPAGRVGRLSPPHTHTLAQG